MLKNYYIMNYYVNYECNSETPMCLPFLFVDLQKISCNIMESSLPYKSPHLFSLPTALSNVFRALLNLSICLLSLSIVVCVFNDDPCSSTVSLHNKSVMSQYLQAAPCLLCISRFASCYISLLTYVNNGCRMNMHFCSVIMLME